MYSNSLSTTHAAQNVGLTTIVDYDMYNDRFGLVLKCTYKTCGEGCVDKKKWAKGN